jgi:hypothetical protein
MTLTVDNSLINQEDSLMPQGWDAAQETAWLARREQVRVRCLQEYSSSPWHQAKAARDPQYWNNFYVGQAL